MRSEKEIITLILDVAKTHETIRAVLLNGSRTNPSTRKDIFQDFDIVYMVKEMNVFIKDHSWINIFGERIILQMPAGMELDELRCETASFSYLMLFEDKNRIDLTLFPLEKMHEFKRDSLTILLLDKDNLFPGIPEPAETDYLIKKPSQKMFTDCCNEFWWVCTYVAKGLWRQEIPYAKDMLENPLRKMFLKIIEWHIGTETGFATSFGKSGKNMQANLTPELYDIIISTYPNGDSSTIWKSLFMMTRIFSDLAKNISKNLFFEYNNDEGYKVTRYLDWVYSLAKKK